jgi:capsular polysaccharide transport system ATP-binding protein
MIALDRVSKAWRTPEGPRVILRNVSFAIPDGARLGILGANGAGKSTLVRILSGVEALDSGRVTRTGRVSFPLGFGGTFHGLLSGRENVRFLARLYGADEEEALDFVGDFAELGAYFRMPVDTYSDGMRARLAFGACLALRFDTYLVDELTAVGDARFQARCRAAFAARLTEADLVMVSHDPATMRAYCTAGAVLSGGRLLPFDDIEAAIEFQARLCRGGAAGVARACAP